MAVVFPSGLEVFGNCSSCVATSTYGTTNPAAGTTEQWVMGTGYTSFPTATFNASTTFTNPSATPPGNFFYIRDPADTTNEIVLVYAGGGGTSTWYVQRGMNGATVAHSALATWVQVISPYTLGAFKQASNAITTQATISTSTTETVLATYAPLTTDIVAGATFAAISYGPTPIHGGSTHTGTLAFNLYWGGSGSIGGAFTATGSTLVASLKTGSNMAALPSVTTMVTGASFDINGELTLVSATTAHANLNSWLNIAAALTTVPLIGTSADTTTSGGASTAGPITISGSGPIILTAVFSGGWTVYGLTANSLIYRVC